MKNNKIFLILGCYLTLLMLVACSAPTSAPTATLPPPTIAPPTSAAQANAWKFVVFGDTRGDRTGPSNATCVGEAVNALARGVALEKPDLIIFVGDLVNGTYYCSHLTYEQQYANWKRAMQPVYDAHIPIYPVRGNHDDDSNPSSTAVRQAYLNAIADLPIPTNGPPDETRLTYSFTYQNAFFVGLDEYGAQDNLVNQKWLDEQLERNDKKLIFVYGHAPAFWGSSDNLSARPKERDAFWSSLGRAGAMYLTGHVHLYNRSVIADKAGRAVTQLVVGGGGAPLTAFKPEYQMQVQATDSMHYGFGVFTMRGNSVAFEYKQMLPDRTFRVDDQFEFKVE
ncbi:MAG: metallophosphoesterase [Chloroflexi bacterium]|nr:metallophosphoesterase [Chloroflexota bacterium]